MFETILDVIVGLVSVTVVVIAIGYFWCWIYACPSSEDETAYTRTRDGWRLALHRYRGGATTGLPVILCHGMGANRYVFDLKGAPSLARYLKKKGRDVWVVELRGSGMSDRPGFATSDVPYTWTFEDHVQRDLPAVIDYVLKRTRARAVHWVGHSMGGMAGLAYVAEQGEPPIASMAALGSPVDFSKMRMRAFPIMAKFRNFLCLTPVPPMPFIGRLIIPIAHKLPRYLLGLFHSPNITPSTARRIVALGSTLVTSRSLWMDFGRYVETQLWAPEKGRFYLENLPMSKVPIVTIAGSVDGMAPPESVVALCNLARGAAERRCIVLGRDSGCAEDYGHLDLLVGIRAEREVFGKILDWLASQDDLAEEMIGSAQGIDEGGRQVSRIGE